MQDLTPCTLDQWADDLVLLCDALGITKPFVLGQSFGGMVAQRYIARHPQHPGRVILSSCSPHLGLQRKLAVFERLGGRAVRDLAEAYWTDPENGPLDEYLRVCLPLYNPTPAAESGLTRTILKKDIVNTWNATELPTLDLLPGLSRAACPVLVIGGEDDPVTPIDDQRDIVAALPVQWVLFRPFAGAGHGVWRDRPDESLALLRQFVTNQIVSCGEFP